MKKTEIDLNNISIPDEGLYFRHYILNMYKNDCTMDELNDELRVCNKLLASGEFTSEEWMIFFNELIGKALYRKFNPIVEKINKQSVTESNYGN